MTGIPIAQVDRLREAGIDLKRLSRAGVELFFTQVFRDAYFHADMHPGNIFVAIDAAEPRQVHRARLRHHGHAVRAGPELPRAELPRLLPPRLPPRRDRAHRVGLGAGRTRASTSSRARSASCCEPIFDRPLKEISLGQGAGAALPRVAPVQRRDPAAARAAAEDAAQRRRPGSAARSRPRPVGDRQALPRALDGGPDRPAGAAAAPARRGAVHRRGAARAAAPAAPAAAGAAAGRGRRAARRSPRRSARATAARVVARAAGVVAVLLLWQLRSRRRSRSRIAAYGIRQRCYNPALPPESTAEPRRWRCSKSRTSRAASATSPRSTTSASPSRPASSSRCSGPPAAARRRCCG